MKDLSILIIHYKTPSLLRQCIKSVFRSNPKLDFEIIVVDNHSQDESQEMIEDDFPQVTLISNQKNLGFPKAVNQGILKSRGKYILVLNPDITVLPNSIETLFEFMKKNSSVGIVGPQLINPNGSIQYSCFASFTSPKIVLYRRTPFGRLKSAKEEIDKFMMVNWDHQQAKEVAWILGSCMMVRKSAINQVGLMDERFFMYMEDVDWCRRFWQKGWRIFYLPQAKMVHYYQRSSASEAGLFASLIKKQTRIHIKSALKYFSKYAKVRKNNSRHPQIKRERWEEI